MKEKGLTLMEIVISVIILSLMVVGMTSLFIGAKSHIFHSRARMTGGELGRLFLDPLASNVAADTWNTGGELGPPSTAAQTVANVTFTPVYTIDPVPGELNMRRVRVNVQWQETPP